MKDHATTDGSPWHFTLIYLTHMCNIIAEVGALHLQNDEERKKPPPVRVIWRILGKL